MTTAKRRIASPPRSELLMDEHDPSESGVRPACLADELDHAFEKLESGAPPSGVLGADDPLAQIESGALLRQMAFEQLRALRERMDELAAVPTSRRWLDAVRPLLGSLRTVMEAMDQAALATSLMELEIWLARAAELAAVGVIDGPVREALLSAHARLSAEGSRLLALEPDGRP